MITTLILIGVLILFAFILVGIYNTLVTLKNRYQNGFAQIEVQLKRRHDLIPNLVEVAKGYIQHERGTLEAVVKARNMAAEGLTAAAAHPGQKQEMQNLGLAEGQLTGAMGRLFAVMENYPDLKANQTMMQLSEELTTTENKVAFARQSYNDVVMNYNTYKQTFPAVMVAALFGHGADAALLEFNEPEIQTAPKVSF